MGAYQFICHHWRLFKLFFIWEFFFLRPGFCFSFLLGSFSGLAVLLLSRLLLRKTVQEFLALLNKYRYAVYGAAAVSAVLIVAVSYFGEFGMISSKRPDIMLYSTSMIFLFFQLFSKLQSVPKIIMFISNYSFSIYLLHAYFMIIGYVLLANINDIPAVCAVVLLFVICVGGPILTSWVMNKFKYGYLFVGKIYQPKRDKVKLEVRDHAG